MKSVYRSLIACLLLLGIQLLVTTPVFATDEYYAAQPLDGSKGQIKKDSSTSIQDSIYSRYGILASNVKNIITFKINEYSNVAIPDTFEVHLLFKVYYSRYSTYTGGLISDSTGLDSLIITYNKNQQYYTSRGIYTFAGGYTATVKIFNVVSTKGNLNSYISALMVTNEIWIQRDYAFACTNTADSTIYADTTTVAASGELKVFWNKEKTADEYDLEWTYVDDSAKANYYKSTTDSTIDPKKVFLNNATRVSVSGEDYKIPLLYDNTGTVFFRVRSVKVTPNNQRYESRWSSDYTNTNKWGSYHFPGHAPSLNWQATTSFAEEGKRKSVVQYYDGSLRSRQTVTKDNTTDTTIIAETFYDYQGRPAVQVLPTPSLSRLIQYTPNFNIPMNGTEYDKTHYDTLFVGSGTYCDNGGDSMNSTTGASKYYSPSNQNVNNGFNKYIPDAKKFPFTETRYTQDNTGRISKQGGVGKDYQIGSLHETKYYYGGADQEELDALFGTEVGNASHYFKNMVRDANGQYSVSYVDMHGRTIATALAGKPLSLLDTLSYNKTVFITKKLLDSASNIIKGTSIESSKSLLVTKPGAHRFVYSLKPDSISIIACDASTICYSCKYDLEITLSDDCNNGSFGGTPVTISRKNISGYNLACSTAVSDTNSLKVDTTITLSEGNYTVTKRLTITDSSFKYYRDSVFMVRNTCKTLDQFITEQKQLLQSQIQCYPTCQSCQDSLGTWTNYRQRYMTRLGIPITDTAGYQAQALAAYNAQKETCDQLCNNTGIHTSILDQMLADVTPPYGQYAMPDTLIDVYSIFNQPKGKDYAYKSVLNNLVDENGNPETLPVSTYTKDNFVANFKPSWAQAMLTLHPEYWKLQKLQSLAASAVWDEKFNRADTYKMAKDSAFLNPTANTTSPFSQFTVPGASNKDPLFDILDAGTAATFKPRLEDSIRKAASFIDSVGVTRYINMWSLATAMAQCDTSDSNCFTYYKYNAHAFQIDTSCSGTLDIAWRYFRQMYQSKKQEIINDIINASNPAGYTDPPSPPHSLDFIDPRKTVQGINYDKNSRTDSLNAFISSNCQAYVSQWWSQLASCNYTSADSAVVFPRLLAVCNAGGDQNHVFGSSTVKPSSTNRFHSFDEVIKQYNDSTGKAYNASCNAYLITAPVPYDQPQIFANGLVYTKPDSCTCTQINTQYSLYLANGSGDADFAAFLKRTTGTVMNLSDLTTLRGMCNNTISCTYLPSPISLPPVFQCGVKNVCVTCTQVDSLVKAFNYKFPGVTPTYDDNDSLQRSYNRLFENFMNTNLGFGKKTADYLAFMDTCGNSNHILIPPFTHCDSLTKIQNDFFDYYSTLSDANVNRGLNGSTNWTIQGVLNSGKFFQLGERYHPELFTGGILSIPYPDSSVSYGSFNYYSQRPWCINNEYAIEIRIKDTTNSTLGMGMSNHSVNSIPTDRDEDFTFGLIPGGGVGFYDYRHVRHYDSSLAGITLSAWRTLKYVVKPTAFRIYVDGVLIKEVTRDGNSQITKINGASVIENTARGLQMDWMKLYGNSDSLLFYENFDSFPKLSRPDPKYLCPVDSCTTAFTNYFNQKKGAAYTYGQIDSIYNNCGSSPTPCLDSTQRRLTSIQNEFVNNYYNYGRKYDANGCDTMTWKADLGPLINSTGVPHNRIFHNGIMQYPDTLNLGTNHGSIGYDFTHRDSACINGRFSIELRVKDSMLSSEQFHNMVIGIVFSVSPAVRKYFIAFDKKFPSYNSISFFDYGNGANTRGYGNLTEFQQSFANWRTIKFQVIDSVIKYYLDGTLLGTYNFPAADIPQKIIGLSIGSAADHNMSMAFDWIKMYDGSGNIIYNEDFNDCGNFSVYSPTIECPKPLCSSAFTDYYNQQQSTGYTFTQIDSIYTSRGLKLAVCSNGSSLTLCGKTEPIFPPVVFKQYSPCDDTTAFAVTKGTLLYQSYRDSLLNNFSDKYLAKCLSAYRFESFTVNMPVSEYHYTLYYYDQAGNLVKTVPPAGVDVSKFAWASAWSDSVKTSRTNNQSLTPSHGLLTGYRYNTLNQVMAQKTPDAGQSNFWYDRLGRLVISQNAKQKAASGSETNRLYSYTLYDYLGRITEVGQIANAGSVAMADDTSRKQTALDNWVLNSVANKAQITQTIYDLPYSGFAGLSNSPIIQRNLRNRVAYTSFTTGSNPLNYNQASFYTYDIHGNVDTLVQDYGNGSITASQNIMNISRSGDVGNRFKKIVYRYDLISGKVNNVAYQPSMLDQFYHRYTYDAENRLTLVETSYDSATWEKDARYDYYKHGPLARTVIGEQMVQGMDYAYTIQGWLKGANSTSLNTSYDMGADGQTGAQTQNIARDAFGFNLNYFTGDYSAISGLIVFPGTSGTMPTGEYRPLYNGNISSMAVNIGYFNQPYLYNYRYDQLNRITSQNTYTGLNQSTNTWTLAATNSYNEKVGYDANGNIQKYTRYFDVTSTPMDSLTYNYITGTNKLNYVQDRSQGWVNNQKKIKNQASGNYNYDEIGNLIKDSTENITSIVWSVYGKILEINKSATTTNSSLKKISYTYDAAGNRISQREVNFGSSNVYYTWYVRDASGNVMATYKSSGDSSTALGSLGLSVSEQYIYGSSRLGVNNINGFTIGSYYSWTHSPYTAKLNFQRGFKQYELTNHLGNVLTTVSDKKIGVTSNGTTFDYFKADIINATDYFPFGMVSRSYYSGAQGYRFGFNGKENDRDVKGDGNEIDYGMRVYDPRIGKFLSVDPITIKYPWYSPYQYAGNKPVWKKDIDGLEEDDELDREEKEEMARRAEQSALSRALRAPTSEELARDRKVFDELQKESSVSRAARFRQFRNTLGNYGRNAFNSAQITFGGGTQIGLPEQGFVNSTTLKNLSEAQRAAIGGAQAVVKVTTPYSVAEQGLSKEAFNAVSQVKNGATVYRLGTKGVSATGASAQFWSLENPLLDKVAFAEKYNVPIENIKNADFIETATVKIGANFVTKEAGSAPGSANKGKGIEVVVEVGGTTNNVIKPIKKN